MTVATAPPQKFLGIDVEWSLHSERVLELAIELFEDRGRPWENVYIESCNRKLRDELLNGEVSDKL